MMIEAKNIKKSFGDVEVLRGVSLSVEKGEIISVIGPSGSGKSTMLRSLIGLERVSDGSISIGGEAFVENGVYVVTGQWLLNVLGSVNFDDYESLQYLHKVLTNGKVYDLLEEKCIKEGDTVSIYGVQFEYVR